MHIHIFAIAAQGAGLSGGDRIFIEFARRWRHRASVSIYVNNEGREMCVRQNLIQSNDLNFVVWDTPKLNNLGFWPKYIIRIILSVIKATRVDALNSPNTILYSASEFWMDALPAFVLKLRYPKSTWAAAWYQTAPNPLKGFSEGNRKSTYKKSALLYWLAQLPIKPLVAAFADCVLVNNAEEKNQFPQLAKQDKAIVVLGAVDLDRISAYKARKGSGPKTYDAVFQGRFHPQKGVVELIDIWHKVVAKKPEARLAMIGDGPLMEEVKSRITMNKLTKNVRLFGYVFDGPQKYKIFSQSKIAVHPALYDSGGMASAEAMAFGLPVVGFALKAYESYYPKGMLKVEKGDLDKFAKAVLFLLTHKAVRSKLADEGVAMIKQDWSWDKRAKDVLDLLIN